METVARIAMTSSSRNVPYTVFQCIAQWYLKMFTCQTQQHEDRDCQGMLANHTGDAEFEKNWSHVMKSVLYTRGLTAWKNNTHLCRLCVPNANNGS
jgi:hypothetical protein